jgi:hypothetical protein
MTDYIMCHNQPAALRLTPGTLLILQEARRMAALENQLGLPPDWRELIEAAQCFAARPSELRMP